MAFVQVVDKSEIDEEYTFHIMNKFLNEVFIILNSIFKKNAQKKKKLTDVIIDSKELGEFIFAQNFDRNNVNKYVIDAEFPEMWHETIKTKNIEFLKSYYKYIYFYNYKLSLISQNSKNDKWLKENIIHIKKFIFFLYRFKQKNINKNFIKNVIKYEVQSYVIFDNIYYTDYKYHIILSDIYFLYYHKKYSNKCYLVI